MRHLEWTGLDRPSRETCEAWETDADIQISGRVSGEHGELSISAER